MMREQPGGKEWEGGGEDEDRARGESEEWREGVHRGAALQILQGPGLTQRRALCSILPGSSLLDLHCSVTQD